MKIEVRNNLYSIKITFIILFIIIMVISLLMFSLKGFKDFLEYMILPACVGGFMLLILLILYILPKTKYIFTEETLYIYEGKECKGEIELSNIISIRYNNFNNIFTGNLLGFLSLELTYFIDTNDGIATIYFKKNQQAILYITMPKSKAKKICNLMNKRLIIN